MTAVAGNEVEAAGDLSRLLDAHRPGEKVALTVGGREVTVTLGTRPNTTATPQRATPELP